MLVVSSIAAFDSSGADPEGDGVLIDRGNGITSWSSPTGATVADVLASAAEDAGSELDIGEMSVDGLVQRETGSVTASWRIYSWTDGSWSDVTASIDTSAAYSGGSLALGFYPEGIVPVETPEHRSSWTMVRGDSSNSAMQDAVLSTEKGSTAWTHSYGNPNYVNAVTLVEGDYVYVVAGGGYTGSMPDPALYCYDRFSGEEIWHFDYPKGAGYETATGVIAGGYYFLPATNGHVYRIPLTGPGEDDSEVEVLDIPTTRDHTLTGMFYSTGPSTMIYDSGVIYFGSNTGYVWCIDTDLNVIWKTSIDGSVYYNAPTVYGDYVLMGALNGVLYAMDRSTGDIVDSVTVFQISKTVSGAERYYGSANVPSVVGDVLMLSFSDGQGMNSMRGGIAAYRFSDGTFEEVFKQEIGLTGNYVNPIVTDGFSGIYHMSTDSLKRISVEGVTETLSSGYESFKGPISTINGDTLIVAEYDRGGRILMFDLDGKLLGSFVQPGEVQQYCMSPVVVIDGMLYLGTDGGVFAYSGAISAKDDDPSTGGGSDINIGLVLGIIIVIVLIVLIAIFLGRWRASGMPFMAYVNTNLKRISGPQGGSKVKRNKRRLATVLIIGAILAFAVFVLSLAVGPSGTYGFGDAISTLKSAIGKAMGGDALTYDETIIFDSRCARAVAAFAVGIGLSVAGGIYQAIIRNPMVDPYIMGVSAGAGVAAVATIAFNFTFFGLFTDVTYATPVVAMVGGLIAFGFTMLLAEKAGGSSINYVLAGIIVGLVFSAFQTLMLSMAGSKLNDAMAWLFGSFANITWSQTILMAIPAVAMSLVSLVWAKEFNLVLLGEDQARQMGLDVRRFNRWMLILASVLASVCVAFVGIIGFVGLVVPHLCRMILGGDHRLVLPASMMIGGVLMMSADLFAKMVMVPLELPVGAITTIIGAPLFAYLLIRKGRMYDG